MNDQYDDYEKYWPADMHVMAKEIVRFHSLIWPAILMALGEPLPKKVYGHGWITFGDGGKMSKSKGNVIDPFVLSERYGVDALRYHLLREMVFGSDMPYSTEMMFNRYNSDLANDLGNLVSRTVAMAIKYFDGTLPEEKEFTTADLDLVAQLDALPEFVSENFSEMRFSDGLERLFRVVARANKYIDENEPWVLAKDEANKPRLAAVLYNLLDAVRRVTILLLPVMPHIAPQIFEQIGATEENTKWECASQKYLLAADVTVKKGPVLFPRIDVEKELAELASLFPAEEEAPSDIEPAKALTKFDNFAALDLRAVKVISCENVPKSDKLLKFIVNDGFGERQVLSGIAKYYKPEELVGKTLAMIINLEPRKMMGLESNGMILSVKDGDRFRVIEFDDSIKPGADIS